MRYQKRELFRSIAQRVASDLMAELKAAPPGTTLGIDGIRAALRREPKCPHDATEYGVLEEMTTRRVVELCR